MQETPQLDLAQASDPNSLSLEPPPDPNADFSDAGRTGAYIMLGLAAPVVIPAAATACAANPVGCTAVTVVVVEVACTPGKIGVGGPATTHSNPPPVETPDASTQADSSQTPDAGVPRDQAKPADDMAQPAGDMAQPENPDLAESNPDLLMTPGPDLSEPDFTPQIPACVDQDGDGVPPTVDECVNKFNVVKKGVVDCDDNDITVYPGARELVDAKNNSCNPNWDKKFNIGQSGLTFINTPAGKHKLVFGDFNGDGFDDVAVGVRDESRVLNDGKDQKRVGEGEVKVFFGKPNIFNTRVIDFDKPDLLIAGGIYGGHLGNVLRKADLNGDGNDDLIIGFTGYNDIDAKNWYGQGDGSDSGAIGIIYGRADLKANPPPQDFNLAIQGNVQGLALLVGEPNEGIPNEARVSGDTDGDGVGSVFVSRNGKTIRSIPTTGYLGKSKYESILSFKTVFTGTNGDILQDLAIHGTNFGSNFVLGDLDGDGLDDIVPSNTSDAGTVYVIHGKANTPWNLDVCRTIQQGQCVPVGLDNYTYRIFKGSGGTDHLGTTLAIGNLYGQQGGPVLSMGAPDADNRAGYSFSIPGSKITQLVDRSVTVIKPGMPMDSFTLQGMGAGTRLSATLATRPAVGGHSDLITTAVDYQGQNPGAFFFMVGGANLVGMQNQQPIVVTDQTAGEYITTPLKFGLGNNIDCGGDFDGDGSKDFAITDETGAIYAAPGGNN